jgi:hypothetical protein
MVQTSAFGQVAIERTVSVSRIGAISVRLRVPFQGRTLAELVGYHDLAAAGGQIETLARAVASDVHRELGPWWVRPRPELPPEEAYTVFCLETPLRDTAQWLDLHRREVAALVTQEADPSLLSEQEAAETTARNLSYYRHDLTVVDWDAALLIDQRQGHEETLEIIELANLALAELEAYDASLDQVVEGAYRDLAGRPRGRARLLRGLGELRIDHARAGEALGNATKFIGDWHLARVWSALADRFHLSDWSRTTGSKLRILDDLYQVLAQEQQYRWMLGLEVTVVLLFLADLIIVLMHH